MLALFKFLSMRPGQVVGPWPLFACRRKWCVLVALLCCGPVLAGKGSVDGPPPCGADGVCNLAVCASDPDCPADLPQGNNSGSSNTPTPGTSTTSSGAQPSRPGDIKDCTVGQRDEIGLAIDWGAENWDAFEDALEGIRDWPVNIGRCLENRFKKNGKVVCEDSAKGRCDGNNGWASPFNRKCHMCPGFLETVRGISGVENRQACYFALLTHEWGHTCERGHKTLEIIDDEAFEFWKSRHPGVTINFSDCDMS